MCTISVVMATYNGESYISEQINSILQQTYRDFEIIIVDDYSVDNTVKIIRSLFERNSFDRYKIIINENNLGPTITFERGIVNSDGKFIALCDQDDIWLPDKLKVLINTIIEEKADLVYSNSFVIKGEKVTSRIFPRRRRNNNLFSRLMHNDARGATCLLRKDFLNEILPFSRYDLYDKWIYFIAILYCNVRRIDVALQFYRIHESNYVGTKYKFRGKKELLTKLFSTQIFYLELLKYIQEEKNIKVKLNSYYVLEEVRNIIKFYKETAECIEKKCICKCLMKYIRNVLINDFSCSEKMIYFYYYLIK